MLKGRQVVTKLCFSEGQNPRGTSPEQQKLIAGCRKSQGCDIVCDPHPELLPPPKRVVYRPCMSGAMRVIETTWEKGEEINQCWNDPDCELRCQERKQP